MRKLLITVMVIMPVLGMAQKVKQIKKPVGWSFKTIPANPLSENVKQNQVVINTELDPMDFSDEAEWELSVNEKDADKRKALYKKAVQDTLKQWGSKYLALTTYPLLEVSSNPDFTIKFTASDFKVENVQLDIDYSDNESVLGKISVQARVTVETADGQVILDEPIAYKIDDADGETDLIKLKHFMLNPTFRAKFKLTRKPEKKRKLLERKIAKYESDILESLMIDAGNKVKSQLISSTSRFYAAIMGVKDNSYTEFNETNEQVSAAINGLSALSKKKKKTLSEITPTLESAVESWKSLLGEVKNPAIEKLIHNNIALASLILGDIDTANQHFNKIPESKELGNKTIMSGSFIYYLEGLSDALRFKQNFNVEIDNI